MIYRKDVKGRLVGKFLDRINMINTIGKKLKYG